MASAPWMMDSKPDPHKRLTVRADDDDVDDKKKKKSEFMIRSDTW